MTPEIKVKIEQINHLLEREEHDSGYAAFVHMRKLWPELIADYARSSERTEEAVKAERERCAKIAEPKGPRPCDCEYGACYCRNAGDAATVASWDADMAVARAIRAPVSGSTEGGK